MERTVKLEPKQDVTGFKEREPAPGGRVGDSSVGAEGGIVEQLPAGESSSGNE